MPQNIGTVNVLYDLTGDFKGQGKGSKIRVIQSLDQIRY